MSPASAAPANGRTSGSPDKSAASIPPPDAKNVSGGCFMTVSVKSPRVLRKSSSEILVSFSSEFPQEHSIVWPEWNMGRALKPEDESTAAGVQDHKNRQSSTLEIANRFPHNPPFPANNTTVEFGRKEWKRYESNRNRSPGGRSGENRDTQGNQKNPPHPGGRPAVNIIDREGTVCLCGWKPEK